MPLTLEQVRALEEGRELSTKGARPKREVINYFAGLRYVENNAAKKKIGHTEILELHRILAGEVMDQGEAGKYRVIAVRVGPYLPPPPDAVSGLMFGHSALPLRGDSSVCRWQWPHRPGARTVGALPAGLRHAPHLFGG
jgi:hypothetical protein